MNPKILFLTAISASLLNAASPGMKLYGKHCVECHGDDGRDVSMAPKAIAGGSSHAKLMGYKNGTYGSDQKAIMQSNVAPLTDEEIKLVSDYVDSL